jgi:hypothetical protein
VFGVVAALGPMDIEISGFEIHVLPAQRDKFGCTQARGETSAG